MTKNSLIRYSILLATILTAFNLASRVQAQMTNMPVAPMPGQTTNSTALLERAHRVLLMAKGDYQEHRENALKHIEMALVDSGAKVTDHVTKHENETQGTSDSQIKTAQHLLHKAAPMLSGTALKHVNEAIHELDEALKVKQTTT